MSTYRKWEDRRIRAAAENETNKPEEESDRWKVLTSASIEWFSSRAALYLFSLPLYSVAQPSSGSPRSADTL